jgi:hypothetical protein
LVTARGADARGGERYRRTGAGRLNRIGRDRNQRRGKRPGGIQAVGIGAAVCLCPKWRDEGRQVRACVQNHSRGQRQKVLHLKILEQFECLPACH